MKKKVERLLCLVLFSVGLFGMPLSYADEFVEIIIDHSDHRLSVLKNGITLRSFKVALGSGGRKGKIREGDRKTPKGQYRITKVRDSDSFHLFIQLNYPNMDDAKRALKDGLITRRQFQRILEAHVYGDAPPQNTALGGNIGIHGIGHETKDKLEIHEFADWTKGCIAMRNSEIEQLMHYIDVGTPVTITD